MMRSRCWWVLALCAGCGGQEPATVNEPPTIAVTSSPVVVGQGQTIRVGLEVDDPDGEVALLEASTSFLEAEIEEGESTQLQLHAGYTESGETAVALLARDDGGAETVVDQPVRVPEIGWTENVTWTTDGPEAREHGAVVLDEEARQVLLIGGSGYTPYLEPLDDVWRYDLTSGAWSPVTPTGDVPAGGGSRRVAPVPDTTIAYLFGGYGATGESHNELYRVNYANGGAEFTAIAQPTPPPVRSLHAFIYDPVGERFFAFGGVGNGFAPMLDDFWVMTIDGDTASWTELVLEPRPSPRYGFFYGFDVERGLLWVFSGAQGTALIHPARDTWVLDVRAEPPSWRLVLEGEAVPPGRRNGAAVFDPSGPRLFVFGGTADAMTTEPGLWVLDARPGKEAWTELQRPGEPPLRSSGFGFLDPVRQRVWMGFGNTTTAVYQDLAAVGYP